MRSIVILLVSCFIFSGGALACVNEYTLLLNGKVVRAYELGVPRGQDFEKQRSYLEGELHERDSLWRKHGKIEDYSDYGVTLVYLKRFEEAKAVFQRIESIQPGLYSTAANLGTTYELLGKNDSALYWIKRSVAIDPASHKGSEWLHVKILEAKIGGEALVNSKFLIGTEFGSEINPATNLDSAALSKLAASLYYQLDERVSFVKPEEKIVALLLFEYGNVMALTEGLVSAMEVYDMARKYGYEDETFIKRYDSFRDRLLASNIDNRYVEELKKNQRFLPASDSKPQQSNGNVLWITGGVLLILVVAGVRLWRQV